MKNHLLARTTLSTVVAVAALALVASIYIIWYGLSDRLGRSDAIVVFGNKVNPDGEPSARMVARLKMAVQLFRQGYARTIIVSGGVDSLGHDEATVMARYLSREGVPESSIILDSHGIDTYATAKNTAALMQSRGWTNVILVSQYFHLARATLAFRRFGAGRTYRAHARYFAARDVYSVGREVVALLAYQCRRYS